MTDSRAALADLVVGTVFTVCRTYTAEDVDAFAKVSRDHNPLHMDRAFAAKHGFPDRVVHGGLLAAQLSELIGMHALEGKAIWHSVHLSFIRAVHPGDEVLLSATVAQVSDSTRSVVLDCAFTRAGKAVARGKATIVLLEHA